MFGVETPKVAILSAVETINPKIQSTLDAAALCKMADRGQITGGILDGPLAFDNAISEEAAKTKKIVSPVAGKADILLLPNLEAGNMVAKQLQYLAGADSAGIVLGTRVPIVLTSRADNVRAARVGGGDGAGCEREAREVGAWGVAHGRRNRRSERRLVEHQVLAVPRGGEDLELDLRGQIEGIYTAPRFVAKGRDGRQRSEKSWAAGTKLGHNGALRHLVEFLKQELADDARRSRSPCRARRA